jgi:hypothetical protein
LSPELALLQTEHAKYIVVTETGASGKLRYEVDGVHDRAETWTGRTISSIQVGRRIYAPSPKARCYMSTKRPTTALPNLAGTMLPSGPTVDYSVKRNTIAWTIKTANGYEPHGKVTTSGSRRIVTASVYTNPHLPVVAAFAYPRRPPRISPPKKARLCRR